MEKSFQPSSYENKWQAWWSEHGFFSAAAEDTSQSFCIMIPPPNVTGKLHMGHALQTTLQDLLTRRRRMQGYNALWLPGTDHAGIATQLMVERDLEAKGTSRARVGREVFVARAWEWTERYDGNIRRQLDLLGASCDWSRRRFTLDDGLSHAVREAFVRLYNEGLISRGEYMVNWSPGLNTAISDLEVEMKTVKGKLYHVRYPVEGSDEHIVVATTRPETMLGDTAVAMHPEDRRYRHLSGKFATLPLVGRRIPFIADEAVEPEFGSGLVKVTPMHDPTDFEIGKRHELPGIQVIDQQGRMTAEAGDSFSGLDRFDARHEVVRQLVAKGLIEKIEPHTHNVGHCQRSGVPVEPLVSTQWFCDVSGMAERALEAVATGELELIPSSWNKTWSHWLENIKPWCISRQLWWGHQIPAWYDGNGRCFVAHTREAAAAEAGTDELTQDPDVLDTWFSSALWPFSTLGWPEKTADLKTFYPTQVLVTGFDILFFWVARMVMTGLHFTGEVPFAQVHLTGLVRDAEGRKMSKTQGNTVDPLDLVEEFGADAVRFTLAALDTPGSDIPLDRDRMAGYRHFGNKIWNAVRFALTRIGDARIPEYLPLAELQAPERWILSRLSNMSREVDEKFEAFRFDEACHLLYHFIWGELCDWYIELSKPALSGEAPRPWVGEVLLTALDRSLRLLHPVMPFLTEELWQRLPGHESVHPETLVLAPYPAPVAEWEDDGIERRLDALIQLITKVRALRAELKLPPKSLVELYIEPSDGDVGAFLESQGSLIARLARISNQVMGEPPEGARRDRAAGLTIGVLPPRLERTEEEMDRLREEAEKLEAQIQRSRKLLQDEQFLAKAPVDVVERNRGRLREMEERFESMRSSLSEVT